MRTYRVVVEVEVRANDEQQAELRMEKALDGEGVQHVISYEINSVYLEDL